MATQIIVADDTTEDVELIPLYEIIDDLCASMDTVRGSIDDKRWLSAVEKAYNWLLQQDSIAYNLAHNEITVESATEPGKMYHANGSCSCEAFQRSSACWHRAAARLVRRALEGFGDTWDRDCSAMRTDLKAQRKAKATADLLECF